MADSDIDAAMHDIYDEIAREISELANACSGQFFVGIAGPPGSGKSTLAKAVSMRLNASVVVPMDGYHYYKKELLQFENSTEAFARRGAPWTFNAFKFVSDLKALKVKGIGKFPSFDHGMGDPVENDIEVTSADRIVIVEGNYLLLEEEPWSKIRDEILDRCYFISVDIEQVRDRVLRRHIATGKDAETARVRVENNDIPNAILILQSSPRAHNCIVSR
jgi:pantothenate kinase